MNTKNETEKRKGLVIQISRAEYCTIKTESGEEIEVHFFKASDNKCILRIVTKDRSTLIHRENYKK